MSKRRAPVVILVTWLAALGSIGLLFVAAKAVKDDLIMLRPCSKNPDGLSIATCGKQSLNQGDIMLIILFALSALLAMTLLTAAWRMIKRRG